MCVCERERARSRVRTRVRAAAATAPAMAHATATSSRILIAAAAALVLAATPSAVSPASLAAVCLSLNWESPVRAGLGHTGRCQRGGGRLAARHHPAAAARQSLRHHQHLVPGRFSNLPLFLSKRQRLCAPRHRPNQPAGPRQEAHCPTRQGPKARGEEGVS